MRPVSVVVVDDHEIVRAGLRTLLGRESDIHIAGMASTGEEGLDLVDETNPDVVVVDFGLPRMSGVELCEEILRRHPGKPVLILTTFLEDEVIQKSLEAGAKGYVYKDVEAKELKRAIRAVANGEAVLDPKVAGRVMGWVGKHRVIHGGQALSIRETEVLRLVARGASNEDAAEMLGLSLNTIKTYLQRALTKLGCHSRSEAAAIASKRGLL